MDSPSAARSVQLDRMENKVDRLLERTSRVEERIDSSKARITHQAVDINDHSFRISNIESRMAVTERVQSDASKQLKGRWAALGATVLTVLGSLGVLIAQSIMSVFK